MAEADRALLEAWLRSPNVAQDLALRAKVILASAKGEGVRRMARRLGVSANTAAVWRRRYRSRGIDGLRTRGRAGRPRQITAAKEQTVISATLRKPKAATHWSARRLAKEVGLSRASVHRMAQVRSATSSGRDLQVQHRPRLRPQAGRHCWALSGPARAGAGAVRG